jgi:hypothetical protein
MKTYFLEIPVPLLHEDPRYPDRDTRHIYEHLKYFCSKCFPLPAVDVVLADGRLLVTSGQKYVQAARELGYPWVRAVYRSQTVDPNVLLAELPPGTHVIPRDVLERESAVQVSRDYHVYFFDGPLTPVQQERFHSDIVEFFERLETSLIRSGEKRVFEWGFPFGARCGEFKALVPVGDPSWLNKYLEASREFSRNVRRIVSFQGALFPE